MQGADLVVVSHSFAGKTEADQLGLPTASVTLQPQAIPVHDPEQGLVKRAGQALLGAAMTPLMVRPYNRMLKAAGLASVRSIEELMSPRLNLIPASPLIVPPNRHWKPQHVMTGYWFLDEPSQWTPPAEMLNFLADGEAPVVVSLGAMSLGEADAAETAQLVLDAIRRAGLRGIVQGWQHVAAQLDVPSSVYMASAMPHSWLFPQAGCVVHHGGFGTTAAGLRAGVPAVVVPHIIDQYYWAQRVQDLGVGVAPIPRRELTVERLAEALCETVQSPAFRATAAQVGEQIRAECGVDRAVSMIDAL
jgi:UDP:flavonoid glycosyltransferase YjiC (YdhE family)